MSTKAQAIGLLLPGFIGNSVNTNYNGVPLAEGTIEFFTSGGTFTTNKDIYIDRDKSSTAANPYTLNTEGGVHSIYGEGLYDFRVLDADGLKLGDFTGFQITDPTSPELIGWTQTVNVIGATGGGTKDIDLSLGNVAVLLVTSSANTLTFSNWPATGKKGNVECRIHGGGSQTLNLPSTVIRVGGGSTTWTDNTATFTTDFATDEKLDISAHGFLDGDIVQVTTSGTLPAGLSANTLYYVINKTTNDFELSTTEGGSAVNITDDGSGTHTLHSGLDIATFSSVNGGLTIFMETQLDVKV